MKNAATVLTILLGTIGAAAHAGESPLPDQNVKACVGRASHVVRSPVQLNQVWINGRTSRASSFTVRTALARYTADVGNADLVVLCTRPGNETIFVKMELNDPERTRYHVNVLVNCAPCG